VPWRDWIRTVEIEPSLYAADFSRLGEQTMGPIVLKDVAPIVHRYQGAMDVHLMVENPVKYFEPVAAAGGDSVTFHYEAVDDVAATVRAAREHELQVGIAFNPESEPEDVAAVSADADIVLCMGIHPGYSGQPFREETFERVSRLRAVLPDQVFIQVDGGVGPDNVRELFERGTRLLVAGSAIFAREDLPRAYRRLVQALA